MNEPEEILSEDALDDLLAALREVTVPEEVQAANRARISRALARHARPAWWRRTVAVPVPIAIAATLAIVAATVALLFPPADQRVVKTIAPQGQVAATGVKPSVAAGRSSPANWSVTRSYLQSIKSFAAGQLPSDFDIKEKRDDS
jgi:hypothetical protein